MDSNCTARQVDNAVNQCENAGSSRQIVPVSGEARECESCGQLMGTTSGPWGNWDAFPAGVKFDPSDEQLLHHLRAAIGRGNVNQHPLIKNYISSLDGEDGICQTHPEHLPGVKMDGSSRHFFHKPAKAYNTGNRKRRKIHSEHDEVGVETRWHKTGKTRPVSENGKILGWKKIMVLYRSTGEKRSKDEKTNWILHQYHLGQAEEETDGELVVCKVFFQKQPRQTGVRLADSDADDLNPGTCFTPSEDTSKRPRAKRPDSTRKARGDPAASSKSDLTVGGSYMPVVVASEHMLEAVLPLNEALTPVLLPSFANGGQVNTPVVLATRKVYPPEYDLDEEVSTSDKPCQNENDNPAVEVNVVILREQDEPDQLQGLNGAESLLCKEVDVSSYLREGNFDWGWGNCPEYQVTPNEGYEFQVPNPNEDYPSIGDLAGSPPTVNIEMVLSPNEALHIAQLWPPCTYFDNDDRLSCTE